MSTPALKPEQLAERLTDGDWQALNAAELDCVLNWLSGSSRAGAGRLIELVGGPRERPELTHSVLLRLDAQLFDQGQLSLVRAHVAPGLEEQERRARFRRLMTAFHPDHHPEDGGWLTPRSQAVHAAWRAFRRGEQPSAATALQPAKSQTVNRPESWGRRSARLIPLAPALIQRLRLVRNLQAKALLALAGLALLPVIWVYFTHQPYRQLAPSPVTATNQPETARSTPSPIKAEANPEPEVQPIEPIEPEPEPSPPTAVELIASIEFSPELAVRPETERPAPEPIPLEAVVGKDPLPPRASAPTESVPDPEIDLEPSAQPSMAGRSEPVLPDILDIAPVQASVTAAVAVNHQPQQAASDHAQITAAAGPENSQNLKRINGLLESYRETFERGHLDGLLGHFTDHPSENGNHGRSWLRRNYQQLFETSVRRRLNIEIHQIAPGDESWQVEGRFHLQIDYAERRSVRATRDVRYLIHEDNEQFRIHSIQY